MMSDFRGEGESKMTPKNRIIEGKNRIKGGEASRGGVKNDSKKSDIIYAWSHMTIVSDIRGMKIRLDEVLFVIVNN